MRNLAYTLAVVLLFTTFAACSRGGNGDSEFKSDGTGSEADSEASKAWDAYFTKCGDSYYTLMRLRHIGATEASICEYRSVSITLNESSLSEADKLNSIEWKGQTDFRADALRCYESSWSDWQPGVNLEMDLAKRSGVWSSGEPKQMPPFAFYTLRLEKVSCAKVPR